MQLFNNKKQTSKHHTTLEERAEIIVSLQNGYTTREIARTRKISPSTVSRINKKWREQRILNDISKSGRPRLLNDRLERTTVRLITSRDCCRPKSSS